MRLLLLLLLTMNLLAACGDSPDPGAMPTRANEATGNPTLTARSTVPAASSPTPLTIAEFQGISLRYDKGLLGTLEEADRVPALAAGVEAARPQHVTFSFGGSDQIAEGKLYIFPLDHYSALSEASSTHIVDLEQLLAKKPLQLQAPIPLYPAAHAVDEFLLQPSYVNFSEGYGVGFFATIGEGTESSLVYAFQGLTDDRSNLISAIAPINNETLNQYLKQNDSDTLAPVADWQSSFEAELANTQERLNETLSTLSIQLDNALSQPAPAAYFSIPGVLLGYDPQLSGIPTVENKPPVYRNNIGESVFLPGVPDAITITFADDQVETEQFPSLTIQPLRGATGQYYASIPDEQKQQVAAIEMAFNDSQFAEEENAINSQQLFAFESGIGKRLVEDGEYKGESTGYPLYQFQGITSDGRYFVEFKHPLQMQDVSNGKLGAAELTETSAYLAQLDQLDQMIQSLVVAADASTDSTMPINPADCTNDAQFVEDITLPDHSVVDHGHEAAKIWRIRNTGTCSWTPAYQIQFAGGTPISWSKPSVIDVVQPGNTTEISVEIVSPNVPGIYHAWWQLADDLGNPFGPYYHAIFESPRPATDIPGYGVIEGALKYPASDVPALTIYFLSTDGSQRFALETENGWSRFANELPVGEYYVFAKVAGDKSDSGGGYTKSVLCDMTCNDHALIPVTIEEGLATRGIDIFDWYAPAGTFPLP